MTVLDCLYADALGGLLRKRAEDKGVSFGQCALPSTRQEPAGQSLPPGASGAVLCEAGDRSGG